MTSTPQENIAMPAELSLNLEIFQGPMDLLLELIKKHEIDIFDIPIALITSEYLAYIDTLSALDLHIGGEWLEMAATLLYIKSRTLLPDEPDEQDDDAGPDPRAELAARLVEYQLYKMVAEKLDIRPQLKRDVFLPASQADAFREEFGKPALREASVDDLMKALKRVIDKNKDNPNWTYEITREKITLRSIILDIAALLHDTPRITFESLFEQNKLSRQRVVTTFVALLEMTRLRMIKLFQARLTDDHLYIERAVIDIREVSQTLDFSDNQTELVDNAI